MTRRSAVLLLLLGCSGTPGTKIPALPTNASAEGYRMLPRPVVLPRGETTWDCGPESVAAVLHYYQKPADVTTLSRLLVNPQLKSTATPKIAPLVRKMGLVANYEPGSMAALKGSIDDQKPPVIAVRLQKDLFHYYVVSGYNDRLQVAVCEERDGSKNLLSYDDLDRLWSQTGRFLLLIEPSTAPGEYEQGLGYEDVGNWERAEEHYRRALKADAAFHEARMGLGICLIARGRTAEALVEFEIVLKAIPSDAKAQNNVANCLLELGRELDRAEELADASATSYSAKRKRFEENLTRAQDEVDREARRLDLKEARIELASALGTLGQIRFRLRKWEPAIESWNESLESIPAEPDFVDFRAKRHLEIAMALRELGRAEEASKHLGEARKLAKDPKLKSTIEKLQ